MAAVQQKQAQALAVGAFTAHRPGVKRQESMFLQGIFLSWSCGGEGVGCRAWNLLCEA
jgi:hypothetical protein